MRPTTAHKLHVFFVCFFLDKTADGFESQFQVSYFSTVKLAITDKGMIENIVLMKDTFLGCSISSCSSVDTFLTPELKRG